MMKTSTVNFLNKHDHIELFGDAFLEIQPRSLHAPLYCGWLLWSYVVEIICLDTDKAACVNKDLIVDI